MSGRREVTRNYAAGLVMTILGLGAAWEGSRNPLGSLQQMGPGFFPTAVGLLLALVGVMLIAAAALADDGAAAGGEEPGVGFGWQGLRGPVCIVAGIASFIVVADHGGMIPAACAAIFLSAMADRRATIRWSLALAVGVSVAGAVLFVGLLGVQMPLFQWR